MLVSDYSASVHNPERDLGHRGDGAEIRAREAATLGQRNAKQWPLERDRTVAVGFKLGHDVGTRARLKGRSLDPRLSTVIHPPSLRNVISERTAWPLPCTSFFSSFTTKPASDYNLLQGVDSEIKCALESDGYDRVEEIPDNEPDNNDEDGDQSKRPCQSSIPLTVVVSKGKGLSLEFSCATYPDEVTIDSMSVRENKESDDEMLAYEGPVSVI
ncbi:hypothetical protein ZIOFF_008182 [Zingiber officinale]|uniref:Uncharacterized protein n=1 Tax=Zingiber officinale TaxID=94328 RepID=A0A8J5M570_ZINOF|nr:hypothetical protein ZIOFF_008182 [Zingiber officinale]